MIIKNSKNNFKILEGSELKQVKASPKILERMDKLAHNIKNISPKSDDFLYFSIIFLKSAEASLYDDSGQIKKLANGEKAWGYFDESWKWHGNVSPHRNNNSDIFPESELKKAASKWVGLPLCRDHESSSVDGIRGIILDTYYDEKFKQVVGLCALDRINYPELARKVETGVVRYGSMGTAVERSICTECANVASTPDDYCSHITTRAAYGEINVGLKPIEYSLVVQPAEPGAVLLKCIASLNKYKSDFSRLGIKNVENMLGLLSEKQAEHLDKIMKSACGDNGCSIEKRDKIVRSFLSNNGIVKISSEESNPLDPINEEYYGRMSSSNSFGSEEGQDPDGFRFNHYENLSDYNDAEERENKEKLANLKIRLSIKEALEDIKMSRFSKRKEAKRKLAYMQGGENVDDKNYREPTEGYKDEGSSQNQIRNTQDKQMSHSGSMGSVDGLYPGDLERKTKMSRANLKERSLRRNAYMQGGENVDDKNYREPTGGYKDEGASQNQIRNTQDKQMSHTGSMGSVDGLYPGDLERKQKISRAKRRNAISKRAGYTGPNLKTRLLLKKRTNGSVDRKNSVFQVFAGDNKVISVKAKEIFAGDLNRNWRWLNSREYGQEVCKEIRASGIDYVKSILKFSQEAPAAPAPEMELPELPEMPGAGGDAMTPEIPQPPEGLGGEEPPLDLADSGQEELGDVGMEDSKSPSELIDDKLLEMEQLISEIQDLKTKMEDEKMADVDVNVNVGEDKDQAEEMSALASYTMSQLKVAIAELDQTADEMAMVSETYENMNKLSSSQKRSFVNLASDAYDDSVEVIGQAKAILSMAGKNYGFCKKAKQNLLKKAGYGCADDSDKMKHDLKEMKNDMDGCADDSDKMKNDMKEHKNHMMDASNMANDLGMGEMKEMAEMEESSAHDKHMMSEASGVNDLIKEALQLRKAKREALLKSAQKTVPTIEKSATKNVTKIEDELMERKDYIKTKLNNSFSKKQAETQNDDYKIKVRRAYDLALDMQKKGLISTSKAALDRQVDDIMNFDQNAFESFKRTVANTKSAQNVKVSNDLGGLTLGSNESQIEKVASRAETRLDLNSLSKMWEK